MEKYAQVAWNANDVRELKPHLTIKEAEEWLANNAKYIQEAMVVAGWEAMGEL